MCRSFDAALFDSPGTLRALLRMTHIFYSVGE